MCSTWLICWLGSVLPGYVYLVSRSSLQRCLFQKQKSNLSYRCAVHWNSWFWPVVIACLLGGTQKFNNRRIILFGISWINIICIPASSLCIAWCLCNGFFVLFFSSGEVTAIAIVLIAADESWAFEIITGSNELLKQNNIISALLFLVSRESEIYTELNCILYLMC